MEKSVSLFGNGAPTPPDGGGEACDLASALAALDPGATPPPFGERLELLRAAAGILEQDRAGLEAIAARLGLGPADLGAHLGVVDAFEGASGGFEYAFAREERGVAICAPDWRELLCGGFVRVATELVRGLRVVLCCDERFPEIAWALRRCLVEAGFSESTIALHHGARQEVLRTVLLDERVRVLSASGTAERVIELRRLCNGRVLARESLRTIRSAAFEVTSDMDVEANARSVALQAFGANTMGGQLPGQVARAFVAQKIYSPFVEALLECMDSIGELRDTVPLIDREAARRTQKAWTQGLDEGATMISGGQEQMKGDELRLPPTVFCNVESHMCAARRQEPLPILCLLRWA